MNSGLTVIMPVFNESRTINQILPRVLSQPDVKEVIIVDDGSTDGTREQLAVWASREPRIQLYLQQMNGGKGAAIHAAIPHATGLAVIIQDGDMEYDPADYAKLFAPIRDGRADTVYGSRFLQQNHFNSVVHRAGNKLLTMAACLATGWRLSDEATCYKLIRTSFLKQILLQEKGFGFCPEVTVKLSRMGARFQELPVYYHSRKASEGKKIKPTDLIEALWCLLKYRLQPRSAFLKAPDEKA